MLIGVLMEIFEEWRNVLDRNETLGKETISIYCKEIETIMKQTEKWIDTQTDETFVWVIDKFDERRKIHEYIMSEYFYTRMRPYQMSLTMHPNGFGRIAGIGFTIYLVVYSDARSQHLKWPFKANVTITIRNKTTKEECKIMKKTCEIQKPINKSLQFSDHFECLYSDLSGASLSIGSDGFIVECRVDLC